MAEGARTITMRMAKASAQDIAATYELANLMQDIAAGRYPATDEEAEAPTWFDSSNREHLEYLHRRMVGLAERGSLFRVVGGLDTLLSPANALVDPAVDHLALHPRLIAALETTARG